MCGKAFSNYSIFDLYRHSSFAERLVTELLIRWEITPPAGNTPTSGLAFHVEEISRRLSSRKNDDGKGKQRNSDDKNRDATRDPLQLMTAKLVGVRGTCVNRVVNF